MSFIISAEKLIKTYSHNDEKVTALHEIDISVAKGEFLAIAGPSGSGKTTLLNLIACLDTPSEGKIYIEGEDISSFSKGKLAKLRLNKIGFIFQEYNLISVLTALENVEYIMLLQGTDKATVRKKALSILDEVGLSGKEHRRPHHLSGGQQQRVAVARAIVTEPIIVLADEPTANLDSRTGQALLELMEKLNREKGITFVFSTHDKMVMHMARRIVHLKDGKIEREEKKGE